MSQPYVEDAADVFDPTVNPSDWLEIIADGPSPSNTQLSNDGQQAQLVGYIPWNKQRSAARWFLGFAQTNPIYTLSRENPEAHPLFPWLYACEINFTPFNPVPFLNDDDETTLRFVSPFFGNGLVSIDVASHRLVMCTVRFRSFRYTFLDDTQITDPRMEWMRNMYLDLEPQIEVLSASGISQLVFAEGVVSGPGGPTAGKTPFTAPIPELLAKATYTLNWMNVPFEYLSSEEDYFFPENIIACLGHVNGDNFPFGSSDPFLPGQLMFDNVRFVQKMFPVAAADPSSPLISVDVSMSLQYFNPPKGNADSPYYGHVLMPWRGGPSDPSGGQFFLATRGGNESDPSILPYATFNKMFLSPNA